MIRIFKIIALLLLAIILICAYSFFTDKATYTRWEVQKEKPDTSGVSWAMFQWTGDTISGRYRERTSMIIPCKIEGLPYNFMFQFDLGAARTEVYENSIRSLFKLHPGLREKVKRLRSPLQFWNANKTIDNLAIKFGNMRAATAKAYLHANYGEQLAVSSISDTGLYHIGTIGADIFQNKILIIDYPNQRFAICDKLPLSCNAVFFVIGLDRAGRVLLPMHLKGKDYKVMFDNGSSIFPLLVTDDKINDLSGSENTDTMKINSWGQYHDVIGRLIRDSFQIAGQTFSKVKVYADYRKEVRTTEYDGITGSILFWDKKVIIDFKNKRFGVIP